MRHREPDRAAVSPAATTLRGTPTARPIAAAAIALCIW